MKLIKSRNRGSRADERRQTDVASDSTSRRLLAERSDIPPTAPERFETDSEISLRQFAMLLSALGRFDDLDALTREPVRAPRSIDDIVPP